MKYSPEGYKREGEGILVVEKTALSHSLEAVTDNEKYDHNIKKILASKPILAWILKYTTNEFEMYDIDTIIGCIEECPEVGVTSVYPGKTNTCERIEGLSTEDKVQNEGEVRFDIRFFVYTPTGEPVKLIINVEAQKDFYPGYDIVTRAIFYCSRLLSSQIDVEFENSNYDDIKKVYSIWLCMDTNKASENTITSYEIHPRKVYGEATDVHRYDMLRAVMVCIGDEIIEGDDLSEGVELLNLLCTILDNDLTADKKEQILEERFFIKKTRELKEGFETMCNLSYAIEEKGEARGEARGAELMGRLAIILSQQGRTADIEKATYDVEFRERLFKEFNLV